MSTHSWGGSTFHNYGLPASLPSNGCVEVETRKPTVVQQPVEPAPTSMYEVFARLARDTSIPIERIKQLMELQKNAEERQAEKEFNAAFARLNFPPISKSTKGQNSNYAAYEDVQAIITPILASEGFSLSFSSGEPTGQTVPMFGTLSHVSGHSRTNVINLPRDKSGSMNEIQGMGSTTSYGMRYLAKMMLNLRFVGEDNDGGGARKTVTTDQIANIREMFSRCKMDDSSKAGFFKYMQVSSVEDILQSQYARAMAQLNAKLRKVGGR